MKYYLLGIVTGLLFVTLGYGILFAWSGLTASDGDTLDYTKWNQLVDKVANVYSSGSNVGIGTLLPGSNLHIESSSGGVLRVSRTSQSGFFQMESDGTNGTIRSEGDIIINAGGANEVARIKDSGRLGIGTDNPAAKLQINADGLTLNFRPSASGNSSDVTWLNESGNPMWALSQRPTNRDLALYRNGGGTPVMYISRSSGNIGVGTASPNANLDINGNIKISDGTQGVKKVLTSDANGTASWGEGITTGTLCGGSMYQEGVGWIEKSSCNGMAVHITCPSGYTFSNLLDFNLGTHIIFSSCVRN